MSKVEHVKTDLKMRRRPEQERSKESISAILNAAAELFGKEGVDVVSMTQIAKEAGMSKPALYRYFSSKQAIIQQLAEQMFVDNRTIIVKHLAQLQTVSDRFFIDELQAMFTAALTEYCELHIKEPYRIKLRAAIHADPLLAASDMQDSRENANVLTAFISAKLPETDKAVVLPKMLLLAELTDSLVRLVAKVEQPERRQLIAEYVTLFLGGLDAVQ